MFGLKKKADSTQSMLSEIKQKITGVSDATSTQAQNNAKPDEFNEDAFLLSQLEDNVSQKVDDTIDNKIEDAQNKLETVMDEIETELDVVNIETDDSMQNNNNNQDVEDDEDEFLKMGDVINQENIKNDISNKIVEEENNNFENEVINNVDDVLISKNINSNLPEQEKRTPSASNLNNGYNVDSSYLNMQSVKNNNIQLTSPSNSTSQQQEKVLTNNNVNTSIVNTDKTSLSAQNTTKIQDDIKPQIGNIQIDALQIINAAQNKEQKLQNNNPTQEISFQKSVSVSESVKEQTKHSIEDLMNVVKNQIMQSKTNSDSMMNKTMDEFIRSIIEPKIITFLDKNLPQIVNNVVEKEIQKIIRDNKTN